MPHNCKDIAQTLMDCLKKTECMKQPGATVKQCLTADNSPECQVRQVVVIRSLASKAYRQTYFECKRSQIDMRMRIRGNQHY